MGKKIKKKKKINKKKRKMPEILKILFLKIYF